MRFAILMALALWASSCRSLPEDRGSNFAHAAGARTVLVGGEVYLGFCSAPLSVGWASCQIEKGGTLPILRLGFLNPGNYAVSDCDMGILKSGAVDKPGLIEVDISSLSADLNRRGFCFLKVEAVERWGDNREVPLAGGFIIEAYAPGFLPTPSTDLIAWCMKFGRTTKGRTISEPCQ